MTKSKATTSRSLPAMEAVYALWDEISQFPAEDTDSALKYLCEHLRGWLGATTVKWIATVRVLKSGAAVADTLGGWRLQANYDLVPEPESYQKLIRGMYDRDDPANWDFVIGHATLAMIAGAGKFRTHQMRDGWIPFREFERTEHFRLHYTELGITDRIWVSLPLNSDAESIFLIDRRGPNPEPHFSRKEVTLAATILRGIRGFHRRLFMERGLLIGDRPLSPVSRRIVQKLLTGMSEKEIAESQGQSVSTTHKYIKTIYERFGVNGRAALMSLWLRN